MSLNAERMQATFIVLAYNLAPLLHDEIEASEEGKGDHINEKKKARSSVR